MARALHALARDRARYRQARLSHRPGRSAGPVPCGGEIRELKGCGEGAIFTLPAYAGGKWSTKVAPPPAVSCSVRLPPWAWAISRLVASPRPFPPGRVAT